MRTIGVETRPTVQESRPWSECVETVSSGSHGERGGPRRATEVRDLRLSMPPAPGRSKRAVAGPPVRSVGMIPQIGFKGSVALHGPPRPPCETAVSRSPPAETCRASASQAADQSYTAQAAGPSQCTIFVVATWESRGCRPPQA
jgi:hypothetical protein